MKSYISVLSEINDFFEKEKIPYVVIGGIALQWWGEPRFTRDIDLMVRVPAQNEETILKKIFRTFPKRIPDALNFALNNRVCLLKNSQGIEIDISLGIPGYEDECIKRAIKFEIKKKSFIKICSAEDLIIHKAFAGRAQDLIDIESVISRQGKKLDINYIRKWLTEFSGILENNEIINRFESRLKSSRKNN